MKNQECRRRFTVLSFLLAFIAAAVFMAACTTPEKAKAQHVTRGQSLLKDKKFQEASIEFRAAPQIDDRLADELARGDAQIPEQPRDPLPSDGRLTVEAAGRVVTALLPDDAIIVADGTSCRHQIKDGAGRDATGR